MGGVGIFTDFMKSTKSTVFSKKKCPGQINIKIKYAFCFKIWGAHYWLKLKEIYFVLSERENA